MRVLLLVDTTHPVLAVMGWEEWRAAHRRRATRGCRVRSFGGAR